MLYRDQTCAEIYETAIVPAENGKAAAVRPVTTRRDRGT
jgi:hypothetical protein